MWVIKRDEGIRPCHFSDDWCKQSVAGESYQGNCVRNLIPVWDKVWPSITHEQTSRLDCTISEWQKGFRRSHLKCRITKNKEVFPSCLSIVKVGNQLER